MRDLSLFSRDTTGVLSFLSEREKIAVAHKLGGDNMGLMEANKKVMETLANAGVTQTFSVSAFRSSKKDFNTTSKLIGAGESQNPETIVTILSEIQDFHSELLEDILESAPESLRRNLIEYARKLFEEYKAQSMESDFRECVSANDYRLGIGEKVFSLLGVGEVIAAKILVAYLQNFGINAVYVDIDTLQDINPKELSPRTEKFLSEAFTRIFSKDPLAIPIIPGYIGGINGGILQKLGRGYTDFTGSRSAVALHDMDLYDQVLLYIQKLYGFKSTDPRVLGEHANQAKSVNHLSYNLVHRAISHRGAGAGLINSHSLDERIRSRRIRLLVGNPTDNSDIALIDQYGNRVSQSVDLVLGRDYNTHDGLRFGIQHQVGDEGDRRHMVYLMGENIENISEVYAKARAALAKVGITEVAGELIGYPYKELTLIFSNKQTAQEAQRVLHEVFVERR